jgi:mannose-1-phosphate guanylyltransferase
MDAVVLVGGEGTRMRPLTYDTPKQMLPVVDRPLVEHVAAWLGRHGVERLVLSLGYRPDAFVDAYPDGRLEGLELVFAIEPKLLDTAGAVAYAAKAAGSTGRLVVLNGDVLTDLDLSALLEFHHDRAAEASIFLTPVVDPSAYGVVPTEQDGRVLDFVEKPPPGTAPTNLINAGVYVLEPSVLERIEPGRRVSIERETFPALVADRSLYALASDAYWIDTGTPAKYIEASLDVLGHRRAPATLPRLPEAPAGVFRGPDCEVGGTLGTPAYLGARTVLRAGSQVSASILGENVQVGSGSVVRSSIVMAGAIVEPSAVVTSSVVGPGAVVGEGARVANFSVVRGGSKVEPGAVLDGARHPQA